MYWKSRLITGKIWKERERKWKIKLRNNLYSTCISPADNCKFYLFSRYLVRRAFKHSFSNVSRKFTWNFYKQLTSLATVNTLPFIIKYLILAIFETNIHGSSNMCTGNTSNIENKVHIRMNIFRLLFPLSCAGKNFHMRKMANFFTFAPFNFHLLLYDLS